MLKELDADGPKYKRFGNVIELQKEVRASLVKLLKDEFGIIPSSDENEIAQQTIEATSEFESQSLTRLRWSDLDHEVVRRLIAVAEGRAAEQLSARRPSRRRLGARLDLARCPRRGTFRHRRRYRLAGERSVRRFSPMPRFGRCLSRCRAGWQPRDHEDIRGPMPTAIDRAVAFIDRNTRHPMRVVGLNRLRLDEYPVEALREALVNAVAHRQYEDGGRKIMLEVFADRVVLSSPGLPPSPITLANLRKGKYRPCSRNPVLAQCLSYFHRIEERGSGFRRMRDQMLNHGLDQPLLGTETGYFQVTFPGPGNNLDRIRVPETQLTVTPAIEAQLNERQKKIIAQVAKTGQVTSGWCRESFGVALLTVQRDLAALVDFGLIERKGQGRGARYVLTGNR